MQDSQTLQTEICQRNEKQRVIDHYGHDILTVLLLLGDYAAIMLAEVLSLQVRNLFFSEELFYLSAIQFYFLIPAAFIIFIAYGHLYRKKMLFWQITEKLFYSCLWGTALSIGGLFITQTSGQFSRLFIGLLMIFSFIFLTAVRYILGKTLGKYRFLQTSVLIIGAGLSADALVNEIQKDTGMGYEIIGFLEDYKPKTKFMQQYPILGGFNDLEEVVKKTGIHTALIAAPGLPQEKLVDLIYRAQAVLEDVGIVPNLVAVPMGNIEVETFFDDKIMVLHIRNNLSAAINRSIKRIFDVVLTFVGVLLIFPILLGISLWIYYDSPGPIIFKHQRIGKDGKMFSCYKFRSMCVDAKEKLDQLLQNDSEARKEWDQTFKLKHDPRITKSGAFLRKTSLDELPQLFNVLKGEMSLVGPRPIIRQEVEKYGKYIEDYYMVRPGITGMWQVSGRSDVDYAERVRMDSWYVRNWSVWIDIVLLWRTVKVVASGKGAY